MSRLTSAHFVGHEQAHICTFFKVIRRLTSASIFVLTSASISALYFCAHQCLYLCAKAALRQGLDFVKQGLYECGVDGHDEEGDGHHKATEVEGQPRASVDEKSSDALLQNTEKNCMSIREHVRQKTEKKAKKKYARHGAVVSGACVP